MNDVVWTKNLTTRAGVVTRGHLLEGDYLVDILIRGPHVSFAKPETLREPTTVFLTLRRRKPAHVDVHEWIGMRGHDALDVLTLQTCDRAEIVAAARAMLHKALNPPPPPPPRVPPKSRRSALRFPPLASWSSLP